MKSFLLYLIASLFLTGSFAYHYTAPWTIFEYDPAAYTNNAILHPYTNDNYVFNSLHVVGWSRDSKFCYATFNNNPLSRTDPEMSYGAEFHFTIQDMKTDKVVWRFDKFVEGPHYVESEVGYVSWECGDVWNDFHDQFAPKIRSYGIIPCEPPYLAQRFPAQTSLGEMDCRIVAERYYGEEYFREFIRYRVQVHVPGGTKVIYRATNSNIVDAKVFGYLKSPYEDRIAVIILEASQFNEDDIAQYVKPVVIGCSLDTGYSPASEY